MSFFLHQQLEKDTIELGELPLCQLLIMNNAAFPWLILVPMRENRREVFELNAHDQQQLMHEIATIAAEFKTITGAQKINIAALGNQVPQLHIHIIARFTDDAAWPNPVWNSGVTTETYTEEKIIQLRAKWRSLLHCV